jgi:hypothetical protein
MHPPQKGVPPNPDAGRLFQVLGPAEALEVAVVTQDFS